MTGTLDLETGVVHWTFDYAAKDADQTRWSWWGTISKPNRYQYFGFYLNVVGGAEAPQNITVTDADGNMYTLDNGGFAQNNDSYSRTQVDPATGERKKQSLGSNITTLDYKGRYWGDSYSTTEKINVDGTVTVAFDTSLGDYEEWGKAISNVVVRVQATSST